MDVGARPYYVSLSRRRRDMGDPRAVPYTLNSKHPRLGPFLFLQNISPR
jgi:hypothetical protein